MLNKGLFVPLQPLPTQENRIVVSRTSGLAQMYALMVQCFHASPADFGAGLLQVSLVCTLVLYYTIAVAEKVLGDFKRPSGSLGEVLENRPNSQNTLDLTLVILRANSPSSPVY